MRARRSPSGELLLFFVSWEERPEFRFPECSLHHRMPGFSILSRRRNVNAIANGRIEAGNVY